MPPAPRSVPDGAAPSSGSSDAQLSLPLASRIRLTLSPAMFTRSSSMRLLSSGITLTRALALSNATKSPSPNAGSSPRRVRPIDIPTHGK